MKRLALICFCFMSLTSVARAKIIERIVAIVNDDIITLSEMRQYRDRLKSGRLVDDLLIPSENLKQQVLKSQDKLLDVMINEKILDREVKKQNLSITIERVEQEIREISSRNNINRAQLKEALQAQGVKFSDYQDFIKTRLERQALIAKTVTSKIKISDEDITAFYTSKNQKGEGQIFEYTIAHIMFKKESGDKGRNKAKKVFGQLRKGAKFEKLASQFSEDPNFSAGGVLGTFKQGEMLKSFEKAIRKLQIGEFSKIVETARAFHILKLVNRKVIADPAINQAKEEIRAHLYQEAFKKQFRFYLDQRRRNTHIHINKT